MKPLALFDLDGTLRDTYRFQYPQAHQVTIFDGVPERLNAIRNLGYLLVGITNQGGVALGVIANDQVIAANDRTQALLGSAALDSVQYCPHHRDRDKFDCDCKKPSVGMVLDALTALPEATLDGAFVVGDSKADQGVAEALSLPFLDAVKFRMMTVPQITDWLAAISPKAGAKPDMDKVQGCLVGLAVGDALGAPLEFQSRAAVRKQYPTELREFKSSRLWSAGEYTDDTQMALIIANSLVDQHKLDPAAIAGGFQHWAHSAKDVGLQTRAVLHMNGITEKPEVRAREYYRSHPDSSAGNGALMRCAPVALFHLSSRPMLIADSRKSARVTHADPKAQSSCVLLNLWIAFAILTGVKDARSEALQQLPPAERMTWKRLMKIESLTESEISSSGYTVHTLEAAAWSFLTTSTFEDAVARAANLGDDADTVAAVTGALAGAYYGYESIPLQWRSGLLHEPEIKKLAVRLAQRTTPAVAR